MAVLARSTLRLIHHLSGLRNAHQYRRVRGYNKSFRGGVGVDLFGRWIAFALLRQTLPFLPVVAFAKVDGKAYNPGDEQDCPTDSACNDWRLRRLPGKGGNDGWLGFWLG